MENLSQITTRRVSLEEEIPFTDAHCHLDLFPEPEKIFIEARKAGVGIVITAGGNSEGNIKTLDIVHGGIYGVVGISPEFMLPEAWKIEELKDILKMNKNVIGIGEIGLDAVMAEKSPLEIQEKGFIKQLEIASSMEIPVVIHSRKSLSRTFEILKESAIKNVVFHYFEGNENDAKAAEKEGWLVSIPPIESSRLKRVIKVLDIESIVAETDSPAVGREPADVLSVIEKIAELKGISTVEAGERMTKTIKEYFYV